MLKVRMFTQYFSRYKYIIGTPTRVSNTIKNKQGAAYFGQIVKFLKFFQQPHFNG